MEVLTSLNVTFFGEGIYFRPRQTKAIFYDFIGSTASSWVLVLLVVHLIDSWGFDSLRDFISTEKPNK